MINLSERIKRKIVPKLTLSVRNGPSLQSYLFRERAYILKSKPSGTKLHNTYHKQYLKLYFETKMSTLNE